MKKIIIAMAAIAAAFTMASCSKEQLTESEGTPVVGKDVITAFTEGTLTKTSLSGDDAKGYDVVWSDGDQIKIGSNIFTLTEGANTTSGKFQGTLPEGDGPFNAYYPATFNGTDWPASQTYAEGNITGSPMKAEVEKGAESLSFKNIGGILRLTLKGTAKVRFIKVKADNLDEITLDCRSGVSLDADGTAFHIAMPKGEYSGVSISIWTPDFDYCTKKLKEGKNLVINKSEITTASFTADFPDPTPVASLPGAFSIADGKQVSFSRGNLYYDEGFKFETKQYSFHATDFRTDTWGLFGWSTSADNNNYGKSTSNNSTVYSGNFYDWGKAIDSDNTWYTLTSAEWEYLFKTRANAADKYGYGQIGKFPGLIILPDEFTDPMKNNGNGAFQPQSLTGSKNWSNNYYTVGGDWEAMEAAGAVFLPAANRRIGEETKNEESGLYWSSSACDDASKADFVFFNINSFNPNQQANRYEGHSVRLVTNLASCTVKFDMNGHGTAPESLKGIKYGSKITKPSDPTAEGYEFKGWYKDVNCTEAWDFESDRVTSNMTLYAKWVLSGALEGKFSIADGKQVYFSKGNLVATINASGAPTAWKFAANQYGFLGEGGANKAIGIAAGDVDLFGWSTSSTNYGISTSTASSTYSGDFKDWGKAYCEKNNITEGTWRTLAKDEWKYLFNSRIVNGGLGAGKSYSLGITYGGKKGLVLYPDNYSGDPVSDNLDNLPEGVVFLPSAGVRDNNSIVSKAGTIGSYWSSSDCGSSDAFSVYFDNSYINNEFGNSRYLGFSVRLVTDVTE